MRAVFTAPVTHRQRVTDEEHRVLERDHDDPAGGERAQLSHAIPTAPLVPNNAILVSPPAGFSLMPHVGFRVFC